MNSAKQAARSLDRPSTRGEIQFAQDTPAQLHLQDSFRAQLLLLLPDSPSNHADLTDDDLAWLISLERMGDPFEN